MKHQLEQIYYHKKKTITYCNGVNKRFLAIIYGGLSKGKSIRQIHKEIRYTYNYANLQDKETLNYCLKLAKKCNKEVKKHKDMDNLMTSIGIIVWSILKKEKSYQVLTQITYKNAQKEETLAKEKLIKHELKSKNVFYLASKHNDCAFDHIDAQGKIYFNQNWKTFINKEDVETREIVQKYINDNGLRTFQSIVKGPTWFITRPNCRHYFKKVSIKDVVDNSVDELITKYDMSSLVGDRKFKQTIRHNTNKKWYSQQNVQGIIDKYKERLSYHKLLFNQNPIKDLEDAIIKDKFLINKWQRYLKSKIK